MYDTIVSVLSLLSFCTVILFVSMAILNKRISSKQCVLLLVPVVLLFATLAYGFDYIGNANNDLSRYLEDVENIKRYGFGAELFAVESHTIVFRVILWLASMLKDYHWLPFWINLFEYGVFAYILASTAEKYEFNGVDILISLIFKLALLPPIMSFAAFRNTLAIDFFVLFLFLRYVKGSTSKWIWLLPVAGILTHSNCIIAVIILFIAEKWENKITCFILGIMPLFFWSAGSLLGMLPFSLTQMYAEKLERYATHPTPYDTYKSIIMLTYFVFLFVVQAFTFYISKRLKQKDTIVSYMFMLMLFLLGTGIIFPELFLRTNYVVSMAFPFVYAKNKKYINATNQETKKLVYNCVFLLAIYAFVITGGGWLNQLYWYKIF